MKEVTLVWGSPGDIEQTSDGGGQFASTFKLNERGWDKVRAALAEEQDAEPAPVSVPLTAEDFTMQYDAEHKFPFIENEDATIMAWGHGDPEALLDAIFEYDTLCDPKYAERGEEGSLARRWAVRVEPDDPEDEQFWFQWAGQDASFTEATPGAFPVTIWSR